MIYLNNEMLKKIEKDFFLMQNKNLQFESSQAFDALNSVVKHLKLYKQSVDKGNDYNFFEDFNMAKTLSENHQAKKIIMSNLLNIFTKAVNQNSYVSAIKDAQKQFESCNISLKAIEKQLYYHAFALNYIVKLKNKTALKSRKNINFKQAVLEVNSANFACKILKEIVKEKSSSQVF